MTAIITPAELGQRIRTLRLARGKTLVQVGSIVGLPHQILSNHERGQTVPSAVRLHTIAKALDAPVGYFFGEATVTLSTAP